MKIDYKNHAEILADDCSDLQKQILVKYTKAILEEMHDEFRSMEQDKMLAERMADDRLRERDQCIEVLREIYAERGENARIAALCNNILEKY